MGPETDRRGVLRLGVAAAALALPAAGIAADIPPRPFVHVPVAHPISRTSAPMKVGVIGSGLVGGTLGELWHKAGHQLMFADRTPSQAKAQADRLPGARMGTPQEVIAFADVVVIAVPFAAWPDVAREFGPALKGKIVLDPTNPNPTRDGEMAKAALAKGTGNTVAGFLPGVRIVRAFNTMGYGAFAQNAARPGEKVGIPIAFNDPAALKAGTQLVRDAGFDPIVVGDMASASRFELGGPAAGVKTAAQLRQVLGL